MEKCKNFEKKCNLPFKLSIFNFEKVEILFKLESIVVDVAFKLLIDNVE